MKEGIYHLSELFEGNKIFSVPNYQRNYAWEDRQLEDFYNDLFYIDGEKEYFMGTILLRETGNIRKDDSGFREFDVYEIIDGQQRISTINIFIKAAIEILKNNDDESIKSHVKDLEETFILKSGFSKIELLGSDEEFFKSYVVEGQEYPNETITPSQKRLKKAKDFFKEKMMGMSAKEVKRIVSKLGRTRILVYTVKEKGDAMLMFETINDRGKPLSNLEKTKSFLMYLIYISSGNIEITNDDLLKLTNEERDEIVRRKERINRLLDIIDEKFGKIYRYTEEIDEKYNKSNKERRIEDDIQRYHWALWYDGNYKDSFKYVDTLKEHFRSLMLEDRVGLLSLVEEYVISLEQIFYAFKDIFVDNIHKYEELKYIVALGRVANFYPLLLASWVKKKRETDFIKILKGLEKFVFRVFLIGRKRADAGVNFYYSLSHDIFIGDVDIDDVYEEIEYNSLEYISEIDLIYMLDDENFYNVHNSKDIRYIFYHYELMLREKEKEPLSLNFEDIFSDKYTIEHILAQALEKKDRPKDLKRDKDFDKYVNRLGNLVLCSKSWNSQYGNKPFEYKKKCEKRKYSCYKNSIFKCQQKLAEFKTFSKTDIDSRQKELVEWINEKWNF